MEKKKLDTEEIFVNLKEIIRKSEQGEPIPVDMLEYITSFNSEQIMSSAIIEGAKKVAQGSKTPNYVSKVTGCILNKIRISSIRFGKKLTPEQEMELVGKVTSGTLGHGIDAEISKGQYKSEDKEVADFEEER